MILIIQELRQISEAGHEVNDAKLEHWQQFMKIC